MFKSPLKFMIELVLFTFIMGQIGYFILRVDAQKETNVPTQQIQDSTLYADLDIPALAQTGDMGTLQQQAKAARIIATGDTAALEAEIAKHQGALNLMGY